MASRYVELSNIELGKQGTATFGAGLTFSSLDKGTGFDRDSYVSH